MKENVNITDLVKRPLVADNASLTELVAHIAAERPELNGKPVKLITGGQNHHIIAIGDEMVRFLRPNYLGMGERNVRAHATEGLWLDHLRRQLPSIGLPTVTYISPQFAFFSYKPVVGTVLDDKEFKELPKDQQRTISQQLAKILAAIHEGFTPQKAQELDMPTTPWMLGAEELLPKAWPELSATEKKKAEVWVDTYATFCQQPQQPKSLHGDVFLLNMVLGKTNRDGYKLAGLIDFTNMMFADPHYDMRKLYRLGEGHFEALLETYAQTSGTIINPRFAKAIAAADYLSFIAFMAKRRDTSRQKQLLVNIPA